MWDYNQHLREQADRARRWNTAWLYVEVAAATAATCLWIIPALVAVITRTPA